MKKNDKYSMEDWKLFDYITGKAGPEEAAEVDRWLAADPVNRDRLGQLQEIFRHTDSLSELEGVDMKGDWNKIRSRIGWDREQNSRATINIFSLKTFPLLKIAAILVLVMIPAVLLELRYDFIGAPGTPMITASSERGTVDLQLPDGSSVTLNAHSELSYPESFSARKREVTLSGEAYFDVVPSEKQPFLIRIGQDMVVEVLGTTFTVRSGNIPGEVLVRVSSGMVSLYRGGQKRDRLVVSAGEEGIFNGEGFSKSPIKDPNYLSWKTGTLEFRNTPFAEVAAGLADFSGMKVLIRDRELDSRTLTSTHVNQPLGEILEEIRLVLAIDFIISNDTIIFFRAGD